jgi:hypothetical protein
VSTAAAYAVGTLGAALGRAAAANEQGHWWRAYVGAAPGAPVSEALLRESLPRSPLPFAALARDHGADPFILLWLVSPPTADARS